MGNQKKKISKNQVKTVELNNTISAEKIQYQQKRD